MQFFILELLKDEAFRAQIQLLNRLKPSNGGLFEILRSRLEFPAGRAMSLLRAYRLRRVLIIRQVAFDVLQVDLRHVAELDVKILQVPWRKYLLRKAELLAVFKRLRHILHQFRLKAIAQLAVHPHGEVLELERLLAFFGQAEDHMLHKFESRGVRQLAVPNVKDSEQNL